MRPMTPEEKNWIKRTAAPLIAKQLNHRYTTREILDTMLVTEDCVLSHAGFWDIVRLGNRRRVVVPVKNPYRTVSFNIHCTRHQTDPSEDTQIHIPHCEIPEFEHAQHGVYRPIPVRCRH